MNPDQESSVIQVLADRIADLISLNKRLCDALAPHGALFPSSWDLTPMEAAALARLWLHDGILPSTEIPHHTVVVHRIRGKVAHTGIQIEKRYGSGYEILDHSKRIISLAASKKMGRFRNVPKRFRKSSHKPNLGIDQSNTDA